MAIWPYILLLPEGIINKIRRIYYISRRVGTYLLCKIGIPLFSVLRNVKRLLFSSLGYFLFVILLFLEILLESEFIFANCLWFCFAQFYFNSITWRSLFFEYYNNIFLVWSECEFNCFTIFVISVGEYVRWINSLSPIKWIFALFICIIQASQSIPSIQTVQDDYFLFHRSEFSVSSHDHFEIL
jgi:hypothetical protein